MIDYYGNIIEWTPTLDDSQRPIYQKIADSIESDIQNGILFHGSKLPPQRVIANYLGVNHGTVTRAYKLCEEKGLVKGTIGKGTFVSGSAGLPVELLTDHDESSIINLGMTLPLYNLNDVLESYIKEIGHSIDYNIAFKYCPPEGHIKHRYIASNWLKRYLIEANPDNIIISAGTQNALSILMTSVFSKSDRIVVDELTYTGLKALGKQLGIILVPVASDENGMDLEALENTLKREKIKGLYLMPDCHNPTSKTISIAKRKAIADLIKEHDLLFIEDATYSFTTTKRMPPISSLVMENSFYIHGTSKAISPSFRVSYIVAPINYMTKLKQGINNLIWMTSPYNAEILSLLQATGIYERIVSLKREHLIRRNQIFDDLFQGYNYIPSNMAMFRYLKIPEGMNEQDIEKKAMEKGVQIFGVNRFLAGVNRYNQAIRISVSSPIDEEELVKGLEIIRDILEENGEEFLPII